MNINCRKVFLGSKNKGRTPVFPLVAARGATVAIIVRSSETVTPHGDNTGPRYTIIRLTITNLYRLAQLFILYFITYWSKKALAPY